MKYPASKVCVISRQIKVYKGKFAQNLQSFQGLLKDFPTIFKDYKFMKNTGLHLGLNATKPVIGFSDQAKPKPVSSITETS